MKNMNQTLTQWVIKLAEASGETVSDVMEKLPSLKDDVKTVKDGVKTAYTKGRNKPRQMDLFDDQPIKPEENITTKRTLHQLLEINKWKP